MNPSEARKELEARAKKVLFIDDETAIGVKIIAPYAFTSRDGDLMVTLDLPDEVGSFYPTTIYHRDAEWVMQGYERERVMQFLEKLRNFMVLEDLADV